MTGLSAHPAAPAFLKEACGLSLEGMPHDIPLYRDMWGKYFWGGWGSFYLLCSDPAVVVSEANELGRRFGLVETNLSVPQRTGKERHVNVVLELPVGLQPDERVRLYARNISKQVRNAVMPSAIDYSVGPPPKEWYETYLSEARRRSRTPHPRSWFELLERHFGKDVVVAAAYQGERLAGALYCIRVQNYLHLLSIAADPLLREARIDTGLYDRAIQFALDSGITQVDFGLTGAGAASLIAYKRGFGGKEWCVCNQSFGTPFRKAADFGRRAANALRRRLMR